jgi:hypothetical protein
MRTRSSIGLEHDLEELDAVLADRLWAVVTDSATPFEVLAARAADVFDAFLATAQTARAQTEGGRQALDGPIEH